jgi:hypothetical protein
MEGFDAKKFDELLSLREKRLKHAVLPALGYLGASCFLISYKTPFAFS